MFQMDEGIILEESPEKAPYKSFKAELDLANLSGLDSRNGIDSEFTLPAEILSNR